MCLIRLDEERKAPPRVRFHLNSLNMIESRLMFTQSFNSSVVVSFCGPALIKLILINPDECMFQHSYLKYYVYNMAVHA